MSKNNPIPYTLTQASPESEEIDINSDVSGRKLYIAVSGLTGAESLTIKYYSFGLTGWNDIMRDGIIYTINTNGIDNFIELPSIGKVKVVATGIIAPVEIKVDLIY